MNAANFFTGIALLVLGAFLVVAGPSLILLPSTQIQVTNLFHDQAFMVSDVWERAVPIDEGIKVNGTVVVSSALTGESSEISMFVADDANYQKWAAHGSPTYVFQRDISSGQSYSFTAVRSEVYHFIFDNTNSPVKKNVVLLADLQRQITVNVPDERVTYVAYGILAVGCLVTFMGVVRRTQVPWA